MRLLSVDVKRWKKSAVAYLLLSPFLAVFAIFVLVPILWSFFLAFHQGGILRPPEFVGLANFTQGLKDKVVIRALWNTIRYVGMTVPLVFLLAMGLAVVINSKFTKGKKFYQFLIFSPFLIPPAAVGLIWRFLLISHYGLIPYISNVIGLPQVYWLDDPSVALITIMIVGLWTGVGFHTLVYIAALNAIPSSFPEAALVDGANSWQIFFYIKFPLIRPTIVFLTVMCTIWSFQLFDMVYVLTNGGPLNSTATIVWYIYKSVFRYSLPGFGAALAVILLFIIFPISYIQFKILRGRRVEY